MDISQVVGILALAIVGSCLAQTGHHCPGSTVIYYQDVNDCHAFFQCSNNQPVRLLCDGNQMYNPYDQRCETMSTAPNGCGGNRGTNALSDVVPDGVYSCEHPNGRFQDTSNCRRYYSCSDNIARLVDCTGGLLYDPDNRICANIDHPRGCHLSNGYINPLDDQDDVSNLVRTFECRRRYAQYQDEEDCGAYWKCEDWVATSMHCAQDFLFYPDSESTGSCQQPSAHHHPAGCAMPNN